MGHSVCQNPAGIETLKQPDKTVIMALFCENDALTEIAAYMESPPDLNNKQFRDTIDYLAWKLVPMFEETTDIVCPSKTGC